MEEAIGEIKFNRYNVNARKDLLHFVEEHTDSNIYEKIGKDPEAWIDELNIIQSQLTGDGLVGIKEMNQPPLGDKEFRQLGNNAFLYRGDKRELRGLWIKEGNLQGGCFEGWTQYSIGTRASLRINAEFSDILLETFQPENFESKSKPIEKRKNSTAILNKRPILKFITQGKESQLTVYAKGAEISYTFFYSYSKPKYRLTNFASIYKTTSKREMKITLELARLGVKVPRVIGYYEAPVEDFLFLEEAKGESPLEYLSSHRKSLIEQDASILSALCLAGYRKQGFSDFDDKIFDGQNLYLIDVDECVDLYTFLGPDYRGMLLNPKDTKELGEFRRSQRGAFEQILQDALFEYQTSLTPSLKDQEDYIKIFYRKMSWKEPDKQQLKKLTTFSKDYMTFDRYLNLMSDE